LFSYLNLSLIQFIYARGNFAGRVGRGGTDFVHLSPNKASTFHRQNLCRLLALFRQSSSDAGLTGHASAEINAIYTHHELAPLRAAIGAIPSIRL
jgi:hypothetical protein